MKGNWTWKKFLALFMAVAMVMASGVFVTTQSFKATDDESYEGEQVEGEAEVNDYEEETEEVAEETIEETPEDVEEDVEEPEEEEVAETASVPVRFELSGAEGVAPDTVETEVAEDGGLLLGELPVLEDYTDGQVKHVFVGWSLTEGAEVPDEEFYYDGSDEVALYAVWQTEEVPEEEITDEDAEAEELAAEEAAEEEAAAEEQAALEEAKAEEEAAREAAEAEEKAAKGAEKAEAEEKAAREAEAEEKAEKEKAEAEEEEAEEALEEAESEEEEDEKSEKKAKKEEAEAEEKADEEAEAQEAAEEAIAETEASEEQAAGEAADVTTEATEEEQMLATYVAGSFTETTEGGITVNVSYDEKIFPPGTTMTVTEIPNEQALAAVEGKVENVVEARGVDITFRNAEGEEIQPYNGAQIDVSLTLSQPLSTEEQTIVHMDSSGEATTVSGESSATGAEFKASSFSEYYIAATGEMITYDNHVYDYPIQPSESLTLTSNVKAPSGKYMGGTWAITSGEDIISFASKANTNPEDGDEAPSIGIKTSGKAGDASVTFTYKVKHNQGEDEYTDTYNIHVKGYVFHFNANGAQGSVEDMSATIGVSGSANITLPDQGNMTRDGYNFKGWSMFKDHMTSGQRHGWYAYDKNTSDPAKKIYPPGATFNITSNSTSEDYTFYAMWAPNKGVGGTIGFYVRDDGTIQSEPAGYAASFYTTVTPNGNYDMYVSDLTDYITEIYTEIDVDEIQKKVTDRANSEVEAFIRKMYKEVQEKGTEEQKKQYAKFDLDKYYITWYVIKDQGRWHVDGVLRARSDAGTNDDDTMVSLDFRKNCNDATGDCPIGKEWTLKQAKAGVTLSDPAQNTLQRKGYTFNGWDTKPDGSGQRYGDGDTIQFEKNTILYAQWLPNDGVPYTLLCYDSETEQEIKDTRKVRTGVTGNTIEADDSDKTLEGYVFDEGNSKNVLEAAIKGDGTTELHLWFKPAHAVEINGVQRNKTYDGEEITSPIESFTVDGNEITDYKINSDSITFTYNNKQYTINNIKAEIKKGDKTVSSAKEAGEYTVTFGDGTPAIDNTKTSFTVTANPGYINIGKRAITITSDSGEWEYDGKEHTAKNVTVTYDSGEGDGLVGGDKLPLVTYQGSQKAPGTSENKFECNTDSLSSNYSVTKVFGSLTVTGGTAKYEINVRAKDITTPYDGKKHSAEKDGFELVGASSSSASKSLLAGLGDFFSGGSTTNFKIGDEEFTISGLSASGEGTDAGTYAINITGNETIKDSSGSNVTDQFILNKTAGTLNITKKAVTLKSKSLEKTYDGSPLENGTEPLETEEGWVGKDGASYEFTGSQTLVGKTANAFTYTLKEGVNENNYNITKTEGTLEIKGNAENARFEVTVTPNGRTFQYDGTPHTLTGFKGESNGKVAVEAKNGKTYYVSGLTAEVTATDVGKHPFTITGDVKVTDENGGDVTSEFIVKYGEAYMEIGKRTVIMHSASLWKYYDGSALSNPDSALETTAPKGVTIEENGFIAGDGFVEGEGATYSFNASRVLPGEISNDFEYTLFKGTKKDNYNFYKVPGMLSVKNRDAKYDISVTAKSADADSGEKAVIYDGEEHRLSGFENEENGSVRCEVEGKNYYVSGLTSEAKGTDVGEYTTTISGTAVVKDESGNDVTDQFNVTTTPGKLVINKRNVILKSASLNKPYDGKALANPDSNLVTAVPENSKIAIIEQGSVGGEGFVKEDGATYTFTGSQTIKGESDNTFTYEVVGNANNYNITTEYGKLVVGTRGEGDDAKIGATITAKSDEVAAYDGQDHSVTGFVGQEEDGSVKVTVDGVEYTITGLTAGATGKNAGSYETTTEGTAVVKDSNNNDVSDEFKVTVVPGVLKINKATVNIQSDDLTKAYDGKALKNENTPLKVETGWAEGEGATYSFTGKQRTVGSSANSFDYTLNDGTNADNYNVNKSEGLLTVVGRDAKVIEIQANGGEFKYDGTEHTVSGFENQGEDGRITFEDGGETYYVTGITSTATATDVNGDGISTTVEGTAVVTDAEGNEVTAQFGIVPKAGTIKITQRNITLISASLNKPYDGKALSNPDNELVTTATDGITITTQGSVGGDGFVEGDGATYSFTGKQVVKGESDNAFTYTINNGKEANYNVTTQFGKLVVGTRGEQESDKLAATIVANSGTVDAYDGQDHSISGFEGEENGAVKVTVNGVEYTITGLTVGATGKDAGEYNTTTEGTAVVKDSEGNNVSDEFKVVVVPGKLTIDKAKVSIESATLEMAYTGKALKNGDSLVVAGADGVTITKNGSESGWAAGEGATYAFSGKQKGIGTSANKFEYTLNDGTKAENYEISKSEGTLTVTNRNGDLPKIEITPVSDEVVYDGQEHSVNGFEGQDDQGRIPVEVDGETYYVTGYTSTATGTDANGENGVNTTVEGTPVVTDSEGNNVTDQFNVVPTTGNLKITKRPLAITSATLTKVYDGKKLVNGNSLTVAEAEGITITNNGSEEGWVEGQGATYTFTGKQKIVGDSPNAFDIAYNDGTNKDNYELTKTEGTLSVTSAAGEGGNGAYSVTVTAKSGSFPYDGADHTVSGFENQDEDGNIPVVINGETFKVSGLTSEKTGKHVSDSGEIEIKGTAKITDDDNNDVTDQFTVNKTPGTFTITKRDISIKSADGEWEYNGTVHTAETVEVTSENGWVDGDEPTWKFTGSQKAPGTSSNTFEEIGNKLEGYMAENGDYNVDIKYGTLKVNGSNAKYQINVRANNIPATYDGQKHSAQKDGFTLEGATQTGESSSLLTRLGDFVSGTSTTEFSIGSETFTITGLSAEGEGTNAGTYTLSVNGKETVKDSSGNDVTEQFVVNKIDGELSIAKAKVTLTSGTPEPKVYDGDPLTNGDLGITEEGWINGEGATYTFNGSQTLPGASDNTFDYELNSNTSADNYDIEKKYGELRVLNRDAAYEVEVIPNSGKLTYDGSPHSVSGFEKDTVEINGKTYTVSGLTAGAEGTDAGEYTVSVSGSPVVTDSKGNDVSSEFNVTWPREKKLVIEKRNVTLESDTLEKEYDGNALVNGETPLATEEGWADGEGATYSFTGSQTLVGESANAFSYTLRDNTKADNYNITKNEGQLKVTNRNAKYEVTITGNSRIGEVNSESGSFTYDGKEHTVEGFAGQDEQGRIPVEVDGKTYYVSGYTSTRTETDAGDYPVNVTGTPHVVDADGNDVSEQFGVEVVQGTLTIKPATIELKSADLSKAYDGKALVNGETPLSVNRGWEEGEGATFTFTGSQTLVGESANRFTYELNSGTKAENYSMPDLESCYGTLKVTDREEGNKIHLNITPVTPEGGEYVYNGEEQSVSGFEGQGEDGRIPVVYEGDTYYVSGLEAGATLKDVGETPVKVTGTAKVEDADGNDVTKQFAVDPVEKVLKITPKKLTLKSADLSKPYDGTVLENGDTPLATEEGWAKGDGATYKFTGKQRRVGSSDNSFEINPNEGTSLANYELVNKDKDMFGELKVTNPDARFEADIEANSGEFTFDGRSHTVKGFKNEDSNGRIPVEINGNTFYVSGLVSEKTASNVEQSGPIDVDDSNAKVTDDEDQDVTGQFQINVTKGRIDIKKQDITLTSEDRSKSYDGYPLTNGDGKITVDDPSGLLVADDFVFTFDGSQTLIGSSPNHFDWRFKSATAKNGSNGETVARVSGTGLGTVYAAEAEDSKAESDEITADIYNANNYNIKPVYGTLEVTGDGENGINSKDVVSKTHDDSKVYKAGDTVDFEIRVKNIFDGTRTVTITEKEGVTLDQNVFDVAAGATITVNAHYVVTQDDIDNGGFTNHVDVAFSGGTGDKKPEGEEGGNPEGEEGGNPEDNGGNDGGSNGGDNGGGGTFSADDPVITESSNSSLAVYKTSKTKGSVKIGDEIAYTVRVVNNGNVTVNNVEVADELTGDSWTVDTLTAGGSKEFETTYTVTEDDLANGKVTNVATATGKTKDGKDITADGQTENKVNQTFNLIIHYVDENGNPMSADYVGSYQYAKSFTVRSPEVAGYTPTYSVVSSDANGMPGKDVEVTVTYYKNEAVAQPSAGDTYNTTNVTNNTTNNTTNITNESYEDNDLYEDNDDNSSRSGSSSGKSTSNKSKSSNKNTTKNSKNKTKSDDGSEPAEETAAPEQNTQNAATGNAPARSTSSGATGSRNPSHNEREAVITIDKNGKPQLVSASDTETPLMNLGLDEHACSILRFLILIAAFGVVLAHTRKMKQHQSRIFELKEKLDEAKKSR